VSLLFVLYSGLVNEGPDVFDSMREAYRIPVTVNHYACKVDLLGCACWPSGQGRGGDEDNAL
jgi:hypothetical protein